MRTVHLSPFSYRPHHLLFIIFTHSLIYSIYIYICGQFVGSLFCIRYTIAAIVKEIVPHHIIDTNALTNSVCICIYNFLCTYISIGVLMLICGRIVFQFSLLIHPSIQPTIYLFAIQKYYVLQLHILFISLSCYRRNGYAMPCLFLPLFSPYEHA